MNRKREWAIEPLVPEEIYTDRKGFMGLVLTSAIFISLASIGFAAKTRN